MKLHPWTVALIGAGLASLPAVVRADEQPSTLQTALPSTTISGYVDTSAQWNIGTGDANVPAYAFGGPSKADGFNLNVVNLVLEKPVVPDEGWSAGYKVNLIFGPDADTLATQSNLSTGASDFAVRQAYVVMHAPLGSGLDVKMGVFDAILGYEVFDSPLNPNFTRSYGYTIEPTTQTGILASYSFCEGVTAQFGIADTFGPQINGRANPPTGGPDAESYKTYMGSIGLMAPKSWGFLAGSSLNMAIINGFNSGVPGNQTSYYIGTTINTPWQALKFGTCYDYAGVGDSNPNGGFANAVGGYASWQICEKLLFNFRAEYATSDFLNSSGAPILGTTKVVETTATLQYDLWKNVISRVEFRWDHSADGSNAYGGVNAGDAPTLKNSFILLLAIAYKF